jgi:hypothetical protein
MIALQGWHNRKSFRTYLSIHSIPDFGAVKEVIARFWRMGSSVDHIPEKWRTGMKCMSIWRYTGISMDGKGEYIRGLSLLTRQNFKTSRKIYCPCTETQYLPRKITTGRDFRIRNISIFSLARWNRRNSPFDRLFHAKNTQKPLVLAAIGCPMMGWASPDLTAVKNNSMDHCLLHSTYFPFAAILQCCNTSIQSVHTLPENRFQSVNADFVQNFSDF